MKKDNNYLMKTQLKHFLVLQFFLFVGIALNAQYISNPSFEGTPAMAQCPPGWNPFGVNSTPDTEPFSSDNFTASHENTYVTLVSRGEFSTYPNTFENCQTALQQNLIAGTCYYLTVDLASRDDLFFCGIAGMAHYDSNANLKIFGSSNANKKGNLLYTTETITNQDWRMVKILIKPESDITHLIFEIGLSDEAFGFGNIMIDNLRLEEVGTAPSIVLNETYETTDLPINLSASNGSSYSWLPASGLDCYDCQTVAVLDTLVKTYTCIFLNLIGCPATELFVLSYQYNEYEDPGDELIIPNVFTPNGDGINDHFVIIGIPPNSSLVVFDRNGKQVYISDEYLNKWNGKDSNNIDLPEGNYWYILIPPGFSEKKKGNVYLKRDK
jgi:gliding motility-associated-like protein